MPFDCSPDKLKVFLAQISDRAIAYGWEEILSIPPDMTNIHATIPLLTGYGRLLLEQVQAHAQSYVGNQSRAAQDSMQLYQCLQATLTEEGKATVMLKHQDFTFNGIPGGTPLLKLIINKSYIDTNATTRNIREALSSLDVYIVTIESNIVKFNEHVQSLLDSLTARGQTTEDMIPNLIKGYLKASDKQFVAYIQKKADDYDDGQAFTEDELMRLATNKYKILCDRNEWNAPTEEEAKIIALEAQVKKLVKPKSKTKASPTTQNKDDGKKPPSKPSKKQKKPDWMTMPPKEGANNHKVVNDKEYWWCPKHKSWTRHQPSECKGLGFKPSGAAKKKEEDSESPGLNVNKALAAMMESEEAEWESN